MFIAIITYLFLYKTLHFSWAGASASECYTLQEDFDLFLDVINPTINMKFVPFCNIIILDFKCFSSVMIK